jgi:drug/metabolite transporter (DMT)-like permease
MSKRGWLLFAAMAVIWGIPYLLIKVADEELTPATIVFLRTGVAALLLMPVAARRGLLRPLLPKWHWMIAYTIIEIAGPWLLLTHAEKRLSSSLSGLLIAAVPLIGAIVLMFIGSSQHDDRLDAKRLFGLLVGLGGVGVLVGVDVSGSDAWAVVEIAFTAVGYAVGPIIIARKLADLPSLGVVAASLFLAAVGYAPVAATQLPSHVSGRVAWSVAGLAFICTALAFLVFFALIAEVGPARATVITYVNPAVALLLGVLLLNEKFTVGIAVGFPLILLGCFFATARNRQAAATSSEPRPRVGASAGSALPKVAGVAEVAEVAER